ncbi:MAG TPA: FHA domain-containing protein [Blastocatellia bacterium]|nr:FHA domain-containing protein [Blastocatellia bacterium]
MTPETWERIKQIFDAAAPLDSAARAASLDDACLGDPPLRHEVESLLAAYDEAGSVMERAVVKAAADLICEHDENSIDGFVVGWVVCVSGPNAGRDYPVRPGVNRIGRAPHLEILIVGDASVSREAHAIIGYSPKSNAFDLEPGRSTRCAYLNGNQVDSPKAITPYDRIQLGETELVFVPLCGDRFRWQ